MEENYKGVPCYAREMDPEGGVLATILSEGESHKCPFLGKLVLEELTSESRRSPGFGTAIYGGIFD